jgi:hypothetical protein
MPVIEVFQVLPEQASAYAEPMQRLLHDTDHATYAVELGIDIIPRAGVSAEQIERQAAIIKASRPINEAGASTYIAAKSTTCRSDDGGLVGLTKFGRLNSGQVAIEEVVVDENYRGQRVSPAIISHGLGVLAIDPTDVLVLDVLLQNVRAYTLWQSLGFKWTGVTHRMPHMFPNVADIHHEMTAPAACVREQVRNRLDLFQVGFRYMDK